MVNRPEPLNLTHSPERLWQELGVASITKNNKRSEVARALKSISARPEKVRSCNGPLFDSRLYARFTSGWRFKITKSSAKFHKFNGEAERAV